MKNIHSSTLVVKVDGAGAKKGFSDVAKGVRTAGKAVDSLGDKGQVLESAFDFGRPLTNLKTMNRSIEASARKIVRLSAELSAGGKNTADYHRQMLKISGATADDIASMEPQLRRLDAVKSAYERVAVSAGTASRAQKTFAKNSYATVGATAQLQDIVVTAAAGMNPMIIGLQQGTQLALQFQTAGSGLRGVLGTLTAGLAALVSPLSLVIVGVTATLAAIISSTNWSKVLNAVLTGLSAVVIALADHLHMLVFAATAATAALIALKTSAFLSILTSSAAAAVSIFSRLGAVIWGVAKAALAVAGGFIVGNPIGLIVVGIIAATGALIAFRKQLHDLLKFDLVGVLKDTLNGVIGLVVATFGVLIDLINGLLKTMWDLVTLRFKKAGKDFVQMFKDMENRADYLTYYDYIGKLIVDPISKASATIKGLGKKMKPDPVVVNAIKGYNDELNNRLLLLKDITKWEKDLRQTEADREKRLFLARGLAEYEAVKRDAGESSTQSELKKILEMKKEEFRLNKAINLKQNVPKIDQASETLKTLKKQVSQLKNSLNIRQKLNESSVDFAKNLKKEEFIYSTIASSQKEGMIVSEDMAAAIEAAAVKISSLQDKIAAADLQRSAADSLRSEVLEKGIKAKLMQLQVIKEMVNDPSYDRLLQRIVRYLVEAGLTFEEFIEKGKEFTDTIIKSSKIAVSKESLDNVQTASDTFLEKGKSMANLAKNLSSVFDATFGRLGDVLTDFAMKGEIDFKKLTDSILSDLLRIAIKAAIIAPIAQGFGGLFGALGFAKGGVISFPTSFGLPGGKVGVMGEAGPEAIMPLARMSGGKLGVIGSSGNVEVNIINNSSNRIDVESQRQTEKDVNSIRSTIVDIVVGDYARGGRIRQALGA